MRTLSSARAHHGGIDLAAPPGTVVVAAREGRVEKIGWDRRSGWYVKIEHPVGWSTSYCHLREDPRKRGLREGLMVRAAQSIGLVGSTGRSSGPHLHFTLFNPEGERVDPVPHLMTPLQTYRLLVRAGEP
jgi:murein DD-endopeptidase MepM/ murein hydrolase activator NlpD